MADHDAITREVRDFLRDRSLPLPAAPAAAESNGRPALVSAPLAPALVAARDALREAHYRPIVDGAALVVQCPACGSASPGLRLGERNGRLTADCSAGCSEGAASRSLARLGVPGAAEAAPPAPSTSRRLTSGADVVIASEVKPDRILWLWRYRIACGKLTVITGDPDLGKSTVALDIAARVTRGDMMPGDGPGLDGPRRVLVMGTAEDGLADTIVPRLIAAQTDTSRVVVLRGIRDQGSAERRMFEAPRDLPVLADLVAQHDVALILVDALMAILPGKVDSHRDQDVRLALHPLASLAEETGAAVMFIRHSTKQEGTRAINRGTGSRAVGAVARSELLVTRDAANPERLLLSLTKNNVAPAAEKSRTFTYETAGALVDHPDGGPPIETSRIAWGEVVSLTADQALAASDRGGGDGDDADEVILSLLADGPMKAGELERAVRDSGVSRHEFERCRSTLRRAGAIERYQENPGVAKEPWWWRAGTTSPDPPRGSGSGEVVESSVDAGSRPVSGTTPPDSGNGGSGPSGGPSTAVEDPSRQNWRNELPEGDT